MSLLAHVTKAALTKEKVNLSFSSFAQHMRKAPQALSSDLSTSTSRRRRQPAARAARPSLSRLSLPLMESTCEGIRRESAADSFRSCQQEPHWDPDRDQGQQEVATDRCRAQKPSLAIWPCMKVRSHAWMTDLQLLAGSQLRHRKGHIWVFQTQLLKFHEHPNSCHPSSASVEGQHTCSSSI